MFGTAGLATDRVTLLGGEACDKMSAFGGTRGVPVPRSLVNSNAYHILSTNAKMIASVTTGGSGRVGQDRIEWMLSRRRIFKSYTFA